MAAGRRLFSLRARRPATTSTGRPRVAGLVAFLALLVSVMACTPAMAQIGSDRYSSLVMDAATGRILSSVNADEQRHPASLTKMMTLYMTFEALRDRRITLDQLVPVSPHAASMEPTKLGLVPGTRITVQQAILGIVTKSANDAASALAELLGGDEDRFSQMMTLRARALGMTHTEYHNASGLPNPNQWTTAHDLAILARHLVQDYPVEYRFFKTTSFRFNGHTVLGHDNLLVSYPGADGIKTGYTDASGFNLVTSAVHSNVRLIGVVMGAAHAGERDQHMAYLLNQGFDQMDVPSTSTLVARRDTPSFSLIPAAHAATLAPMVSRAARWSVQVGAFGKEAAAQHAADVAQRLAGSGDAAVERATVARKVVWRAQVTGLTDAEARGACASLAKHRQPCTPVRSEAGQIASR
jgi:D-alanyl-D-alanine carboxypeptidase